MLYNIDPNLWGKHFWATGHYLTISYPHNPSDDDKKNIKLFFELYEKILPCQKCRSHYSDNLKKYPLNDNVLNSRYKLIEWFVNLHNDVNNKNGKKIISVDDAINIYLNPQQNQSIFSNIDYTNILTILLLIILIFILIYYCQYYY
jgi:hypothetical protein